MAPGNYRTRRSWPARGAPRRGRNYARKGYRRSASSYARGRPIMAVATGVNSTSGKTTGRVQTSVMRGPGTLWPDKIMMKMRYTDTVNYNFTSTGGFGASPINVVYKVNSLWDPLNATASEQNLAGYLEMAAMYGSYRVHASKVTVDITVYQPSTTISALPVYCLMTYSPLLNAVPSGLASFQQALGNRFTVWGTGTQFCAPIHLENYATMKQLIGSDVVNTDNDYAGPNNGDPAKLIYGVVSLMSPNSAFAYAIGYLVTIDFWCEWFKRDWELT